MTSTHLELDQLANRFAWPVRALASSARLLDPVLRSSTIRRLVKAGVDFCCGAGAVVAAVAVGEGIRVFGVDPTATLAVLVGLLLVLVEAWSGSYRTIWRYTSLPEAITTCLSSALVLGLLIGLRSLGVVHLSAATLLLAALLMLFLCVGARTLRRWSVAEAKQRERRAGATRPALRRVMIAGAGEHSLSIGRELARGAAPGVELVGFLDDDSAKLGAVLNDVPVLGGLNDALALAERHQVREVIVAMPSADRDVVRGVLALAAIVGDPACNLDPEETINLNYTATKVLAEACNFYRVRRLVFASSCSVYGASSHGVLTEQSSLKPVSLYARTRVLSENILFDRAGEVQPVVLRLSTVFGLSPRMRFDLVVNTLTVRAVVDRKIAIFGGNQWRPNVHCRDAARAFIAALEAPAERVAGEIFNVGGDALNHPIAELGDMVAEIVRGTEVVHEKDAPDPRDYRVSFEKIRRVLGFEPEFTVAAGIREVAAAVRSQPALRDYQNPVYHNVEALKQTFTTPRRRRGDWAPPRELARA